MLRDVGIFMLGLAAVAVAVHCVFIRVDPVADMQKVMLMSFTQNFEKGFAQSRK